MTSGDSLPDGWGPVLAANAERLGCFAERVRYVPETPSTNDAVLDLALAGAPEGTALVAGRQRPGVAGADASGFLRQVQGSTSRWCSGRRRSRRS